MIAGLNYYCGLCQKWSSSVPGEPHDCWGKTHALNDLDREYAWSPLRTGADRSIGPYDDTASDIAGVG